MTTIAALIICTTSGQMIDQSIIPVAREHINLFSAASADGTDSQLCFFNDNTLNIVSHESLAVEKTIPLPEGAMAVDIADVDGLLGREIVVMTRTDVRVLPLDGEGAARTLALFDPPYGAHTGPTTTMLVTTHEGAPAIIAFYTDRVELVRFDESVVYTSADRIENRDGDGQSTDERVEVTRIEDGAFSAFAKQMNKFTLPASVQQAKGNPTNEDEWPKEFARYYHETVSSGTNSTRAYFVPDYDARSTKIMLAQRGLSAERARNATYRGWPVRSFGMPDMTGDGSGDLLLWSTRDPGMSVQSLSRAATRATWPATIALHPFDPENGQFASMPSGRVTIELPVQWFLDPNGGAPFRLMTAPDLDNDDINDLGLATSDNEFAFWLSSEREIPEGPMHTIPVEPPLREAWTITQMRGRDILVLHYADRLHLIRYKSTP